MTKQHPITPPPELAQTLWNEMRNAHHEDIPCSESWNRAIAKAYQAGADMELDACCKWMKGHFLTGSLSCEKLRDARRPKPPSKAESALNALEHILRHSQTDHGASTIRLALEHLKKLEESTND